MALSKPKVEDILDNKRVLTCTLCDKIFQKPIVLPCLHTFCKKCIRDTIARSKTDGGLTGFNCPTCRIPVKPNDLELDVKKWTSSLTRNVVMEIMITLSEGKQQRCQTCARSDETSIATVWCATCEEAMCQKCIGMHNRMKLLKNHRVVKVENISEELHGVYKNAVPTICQCQNANAVKCFCRDHDVILCYNCRDTAHSQCIDVYDIRTLTKNDNNFQKRTNILIKLRELFFELQSEEEKMNEMLKQEILSVIQKETNSIEKVMVRLDSYLESFEKTVLVFQEEEMTKSNEYLRALEELADNVKHWQAASTMLKEQDSERKGFVFIHAVKKQLRGSIGDISHKFKPKVISDLVFQKSDLLRNLKKCNNIGSLTITKKYPHYEMDSINECCESLKVPCEYSFENVDVKFLKTIRVDCAGWLMCGEYLDREFLLVGESGAWKAGRILMIEISTGSIVTSTMIGGNPKRLCIDKYKNQIFVSCFCGDLFRIKLQDNELKKPEKLIHKLNKEHIGGMVVRGDNVYVIVNGGIKTFASSVDSHPGGDVMVMALDTNTISTGCNTDRRTYKGNLLFTSNDNEIKCTTFDGKDIFCSKDATITSPIAVSVLPSGVVLLLDFDQGGKLHLLSTDGRRCRTILQNFKTVTSPEDLWVDSKGQTLYVCGRKEIEVYEILSKFS